MPYLSHPSLSGDPFVVMIIMDVLIFIYHILTAVNTLLSPVAGAGTLPDVYAHRYQPEPKNNTTTTSVSPNATSVSENNELYSRQSSSDAYLEEAGKAFLDGWLRHGSR
jgi:hypothetical protein